jgi:fructose-1,6-bisphosphatase I
LELSAFLRKNAGPEFSSLAAAISRACLKVRDSIPSKSGMLSAVNPSGETQKAIDVYSNDLFVRTLIDTGEVAEVASEEMAEPVKGKGKLHVAMDPLDGSSNIGTNNPVGSIFGFYRSRLPCSGRNMDASLYVTYGPMLTLTLALKGGVHRFVATRAGSRTSFQLLESGLRIPAIPEVYGIGGSRKEWIPPVKKFADSLEERGMRVRYCGTFVGDFNQVLARGGVFAYPALLNRPRGKLRVLYETAPMAFVTEEAGGYSTDGTRSLLDLEPSRLSETSPAYLGSAPLVRELEALLSP